MSNNLERKISRKNHKNKTLERKKSKGKISKTKNLEKISNKNI